MHLKQNEQNDAATVFDVTEEDFDAAVVARSQQTPVLVDIGADWCAPYTATVADAAPSVAAV